MELECTVIARSRSVLEPVFNCGDDYEMKKRDFNVRKVELALAYSELRQTLVITSHH